MPQTLAAITHPLTFRELKAFAATGGPALTVYLPSEVPGGATKKLPARLRKLSGEIKERCSERGLSQEEIAAFVTPFESSAESIGESGAEGPTLALFRSQESFQWFWIPREVPQSVTIADNFFVRPVLDLMHGEQRFYILAIAQKEVRLLRCTEHSSEEVPLPPDFPTNLVEFVATDQPDHNLRNKATSGPGPGTNPTGRNVSFGTGTDKEHKDEYFHQFFTAMNRAVVDLLKGEEKTPLVLAGVEFELAIYRRENTYQCLCATDVQGAPNGLRGAELHTRALECVEEWRRARTADLLAQHEKQAGGVADASVAEIVKAAYEGRVGVLLVGRTAEAYGNFDEAAHRVHQHKRPAGGDEDLINAAAVQTVLHAGDVHVLEDAEVPGGRPMAAVMRY
jgi:hypothetical protein